jgi:hypothetical protein
MTVLAFSIAARGDWRWRIVDYNGATVEESSETFVTIGLALAAGGERLHQQEARDRGRAVWPARG